MKNRKNVDVAPVSMDQVSDAIAQSAAAIRNETIPEVTTAPEAKPEAKAKVLWVKPGVTYRGAREAWYKRCLEFNGKTLAELTESVTKDRPSVYGARSKHSGDPEPVAGWLRFFVRTGVMKEVDQA